jgi:hypothetical protein
MWERSALPDSTQSVENSGFPRGAWEPEPDNLLKYPKMGKIDIFTAKNKAERGSPRFNTASKPSTSHPLAFLLFYRGGRVLHFKG